MAAGFGAEGAGFDSRLVDLDFLFVGVETGVFVGVILGVLVVDGGAGVLVGAAEGSGVLLGGVGGVLVVGSEGAGGSAGAAGGVGGSVGVGTGDVFAVEELLGAGPCDSAVLVTACSPIFVLHIGMDKYDYYIVCNDNKNNNIINDGELSPRDFGASGGS